MSKQSATLGSIGASWQRSAVEGAEKRNRPGGAQVPARCRNAETSRRVSTFLGNGPITGLEITDMTRLLRRRKLGDERGFSRAHNSGHLWRPSTRNSGMIFQLSPLHPWVATGGGRSIF